MNFPVQYQPLPGRTPLVFPRDKSIAVCIIVNVEYFEPGVVSTSVNPGFSHHMPDIFNHSWREYGSRVGIWRLMDSLDRFGVPATVALNANVCSHYPQLVKEFMDRSWCLMGHGSTNSKLLTGLSESEERDLIHETLLSIERTTGQRPEGWLSPALAESWNTLEILEELGVCYVCDWLNDEEPYHFNTKYRRLVSMPYSNEMNDIHCFLRCSFTGSQYLQVLMDQFERLYMESKKRPKVMAIPLHPFIIGHPHRIKYLEQAIQVMRAQNGVWFCRTSDVYRVFVEHYGVSQEDEVVVSDSETV